MNLNNPYQNLTREEKLNVTFMTLLKKFNKLMIEANKNKENLGSIRKSIKSGKLDSRNLEAAKELEVTFKADAISYWNRAQIVKQELEKSK